MASDQAVEEGFFAPVRGSLATAAARARRRTGAADRTVIVIARE